MVTALDWVTEAERHLYGTRRPKLNRLNGAILANPGTLTLEFASPLPSEGSRLAVDLEVFHVWSVAAQVATVAGGQQGSTAASHADDALVFVDPQFDRFSIFQAINATLDSLSAPDNGLYRVATLDFTWMAAYEGYDLTGVTSIEDIIDVRTEEYGTSRAWRDLAWTVKTDLPTNEFASGMAVFVPGGLSGQMVRVRYKAPFARLVDLATNAATTGLPTTAYDLPALGAQLRLMAPREISHNFTSAQGDPRRAEEVPPGAVGQSYRGVAAEWQRRVREEAARLHRRYPTRQRTQV